MTYEAANSLKKTKIQTQDPDTLTMTNSGFGSQARKERNFSCLFCQVMAKTRSYVAGVCIQLDV